MSVLDDPGSPAIHDTHRIEHHEPGRLRCRCGWVGTDPRTMWVHLAGVVEQLETALTRAGFVCDRWVVDGHDPGVVDRFWDRLGARGRQRCRAFAVTGPDGTTRPVTARPDRRRWARRVRRAARAAGAHPDGEGTRTAPGDPTPRKVLRNRYTPSP